MIPTLIIVYGEGMGKEMEMGPYWFIQIIDGPSAWDSAWNGIRILSTLNSYHGMDDC